jgi:hypothetical protein
MITRDQILAEHLLMNFYPPYPAPLRRAIRNAFQEYWEGKIKSEDVFARVNELGRSQHVILVDEGSFVHQFEFFLEEPKCQPVSQSSKS